MTDPRRPPMPTTTAADHRALKADETLVELRCSVVVFHRDTVLLLHRPGSDEWVLPGGRPRPGESLISCARREVQEETGLDVAPGRCALVLEVAPPPPGPRVVEVVFLSQPAATAAQPHSGEPGRIPQWVALERLSGLSLRPPIGGHIRSLRRDSATTAAYLGNVWRPNGLATNTERPAPLDPGGDG